MVEATPTTEPSPEVKETPTPPEPPTPTPAPIKETTAPTPATTNEPEDDDGGDVVVAPTTNTPEPADEDDKTHDTPPKREKPATSYYKRHGQTNRRDHHGRGGHRGGRAMYQNDDGSDRSRRVYVGNLSWDVSWRELKDHMMSTGCDVARANVMTNSDGRSKGCGIVEFADAANARQAVLTLNDTELMGRQIFVREDREDGNARDRAGSHGGNHNARGQDTSHNARGEDASHSGREEDASDSNDEDSDCDEEGDGDGDGDGDAQSRRVYVGNLSWDVAWQDLKDHMREAGDVIFAEVMTEMDGRSKGCGIVEFSTSDEAMEAITNLTDTDLKGRMIFVREDREVGGGNQGGGGGGGRGARGGGGAGRQSCSVYVGNLAFETSWQDLKDFMRAAGNVDQANILTGSDGRSKGCGIVIYQKPQEAARAIRELQNSDLDGRPIFVREDREQGSANSNNFNSGGFQLFVGNLSYDTSWRELKDHFRSCGDVERAEVMEGPDGRKKGFGTIRFYKKKDANNAIRSLNGIDLMGRRLEVRLDHKAN